MMDILFHSPKFWLAISFVIFLVLFVKYAFPFILKAIDSKSAEISANLDNAKKMRSEASTLLTEAQRYYDDSVKHSDQLIKDAANESDKIINEYKLKVESEIAKKMQAAKDRISSEEKMIIDSVKSEVVELIFSAIKKDLERIKSGDSVDFAIKNSINQITSKLVN